MEGYIKIRFKVSKSVGLGGESVWAKQISPVTATIENIPFFTNKASLFDKVLIVDNGEGFEFVRVLKKVTRQYHLRYKAKTPEEATNNFRTLVNHLKEHGIYVEGGFPGFAVLAYPVNMKPEKLEEAVDAMDSLLETSEE